MTAPEPQSVPRTDDRVTRVPGMPALLAMSTLAFGGFALLMPVAPLWAVHGGTDETGAGLVNAVLMGATVLGQTAVPAALRRIGWRATLAVGMVLLGAPGLALMATDELGPMLAVSAFRGFGFAVVTVCGATAVAELVDVRRRGRAIGAYGLAVGGPQFVLLPVAAWLAEHVGFGLVFTLAAAPLLAVPFALRLGRRLDHDHRPVADRTGDEHGRLTGLVVPTLMLLLITTPGGALLTFTPQFPVDSATATAGLLVFTGITAVTRWLVGGPADRYGARAFLAPLLLAGAGGLALCAWAVSTGRPAVLVLGMALVGTAYGSLQNLTLVVAFGAVRPGDRGVASAVWNIGFDAGTGVGALFVGAVASGAGFDAGLLVTAVGCAAAAPLALLVRRRPSG